MLAKSSSGFLNSLMLFLAVIAMILAISGCSNNDKIERLTGRAVEEQSTSSTIQDSWEVVPQPAYLTGDYHDQVLTTTVYAVIDYKVKGRTSEDVYPEQYGDNLIFRANFSMRRSCSYLPLNDGTPKKVEYNITSEKPVDVWIVPSSESFHSCVSREYKFPYYEGCSKELTNTRKISGVCYIKEGGILIGYSPTTENKVQYTIKLSPTYYDVNQIYNGV